MADASAFAGQLQSKYQPAHAMTEARDRALATAHSVSHATGESHCAVYHADQIVQDVHGTASGQLSDDDAPWFATAAVPRRARSTIRILDAPPAGPATTPAKRAACTQLPDDHEAADQLILLGEVARAGFDLAAEGGRSGNSSVPASQPGLATTDGCSAGASACAGQPTCCVDCGEGFKLLKAMGRCATCYQRLYRRNKQRKLGSGTDSGTVSAPFSSGSPAQTDSLPSQPKRSGSSSHTLRQAKLKQAATSRHRGGNGDVEQEEGSGEQAYGLSPQSPPPRASAADCRRHHSDSGSRGGGPQPAHSLEELVARVSGIVDAWNRKAVGLQCIDELEGAIRAYKQHCSSLAADAYDAAGAVYHSPGRVKDSPGSTTRVLSPVLSPSRVDHPAPRDWNNCGSTPAAGHSGGLKMTLAAARKLRPVEMLVLAGLLKDNDTIHYKKKSGQVQAYGTIKGTGILCHQCNQIVGCTEFERCAGSALRRPTQNIYDEWGRSVQELMVKAERILCSSSTLGSSGSPNAAGATHSPHASLQSAVCN